MIKKRLFNLAFASLAVVGGVASAADMASPPHSLVISDSGKIGVGTPTPGYPLHVVGSGVGALLRLEAEEKPRFAFENSVTDVVWLFGMTGGDDLTVKVNNSGETQLKLFQNGDLTILGALTEGSDRNNKQVIKPVDEVNVLETVAQLPISTWEYKGQDGVKHLGPMAQDFHAAFGLGHTPKGISSIDTGGVALAAIKGLNEVVQSNDKKMSEVLQAKEREIDSLRAENKELFERLTMLENLVNKLTAKDVAMHQQQ